MQWARDANGYAHCTYVTPTDARIQIATPPKGSPPPDAPSSDEGQAILRLTIR